MIKLNEFRSNVEIFINPDHIVSVFKSPKTDEDGNPNPNADKTVVVFLGGSVVVNESVVDVLTIISEDEDY